MYEAFFDLKRRPFAATPDPLCFLASETMQAALDEIVICVEQGQGIAVVSAPAGTGKTLLCERLRSELADRFEVVLLRHASFLTRRALLQTMLCELNHAYRQQDEQELRLELAPAIRALRPQREALVLICDEAHQLSEDLLEELRILSDLAEQGRPLVRLVLVGQLGLEETLAMPSLEALSQRIRAHVCLETLSHAGSLDYIDYRLTWAGGRTDDIFTAEAVELASRAADGMPRCLNQLCDHALLLAYVAEQRPVPAEMIREALQDLRQLPLHWNESSLTEPTRTATNSFESAADFEEPTFVNTTFENSHAGEAPAEMESIEIGADLPRTSWTFPASNVAAPVDTAVSAIEAETPTCEPPIATKTTDAVPSENHDGTCSHETFDEPCGESAFETTASWEVGRVASSIVPLMPSVPAQMESTSTEMRLPGGFVEELVLDRYAAIDAGLEPTELMVTDSAASIEVPPAAVAESMAQTDITSQSPVSESRVSHVDADFDEVCERLAELLPEIEDDTSWDSTSLHREFIAESAGNTLLNTIGEGDEFSDSVEFGDAVEMNSMEDRLGVEVCQLAEQLQQTLDLPTRRNSPVEQLRALLTSVPAEQSAATGSFEIGADSTLEFSTRVERGAASAPNASTAPQEHISSAPPTTRPYRNLFSQLRRKQQGLL